VHSGSADFGHYYSYIKERVPSNGKERRWFEFNDTLVTPFDPAKIPSETFGGEDEFAEWVDLAHTQKRTVKRQKTHNAYILIYERKSLANPSLMMAEADWRTVASQKNELRRSKQHRRYAQDFSLLY
jgi:ubiquitin carboxyl-terminal hydrolase 34